MSGIKAGATAVSISKCKLVVLVCGLVLLQCLAAIGVAHADSELPRFIDAIKPAEIFPGADRLGSPSGDPPVAPAYKQGEQLRITEGEVDDFSWAIENKFLVRKKQPKK